MENTNRRDLARAGQHYFLEVLGEERIKDISVVSFSAVEQMGLPYQIDILATHPEKLAPIVLSAFMGSIGCSSAACVKEQYSGIPKGHQILRS